MRFYKLDDIDNYEPAEEVIHRREIIGWCPIYGRWHPAIVKEKGGEDAILTINLSSPNIRDFMSTWGAGRWMITDRVAQLFKEQGFTGYELKPVRVNKVKRMRKTSKPIPKLWELVITGFVGMAPPESGIKLINFCDACGYLKYSGLTNPSILINQSRWDGRDFFIVWPLPKFIFCTEKVKHFVEDKKLTGCQFIPVENLKTTDGYSPGKLSYWMPEDRAHMFGEPLGIYVDPKELWEKAIQLDDKLDWPDGLGSGDNEWDREWRDFLRGYKGILSKDVLLEQLEKMLRKYTIIQAIEDIDKKINEVKNINM